MTMLQRTREIASAFQDSFKRDNSDQLNAFTLQELRDTDAMLGNRDLNDGYRIRLRQRIQDLERAEYETRDQRKWVRRQPVVFLSGVVSGLLVAAVSFYLFG